MHEHAPAGVRFLGHEVVWHIVDETGGGARALSAEVLANDQSQEEAVGVGEVGCSAHCAHIVVTQRLFFTAATDRQHVDAGRGMTKASRVGGPCQVKIVCSHRAAKAT